MRTISSTLALLLLLAVAACAQRDAFQETASTDARSAVDGTVLQDSTHRVAVAEGFAGPEAVRYDPEQDVYFVSNFNGGGLDRDANGFISRVAPDGTVEALHFMTGTADAPLHAPRGMFIAADTLWAADVDGLHGFDRRTGAHLAFVDFARFEPGFLNDVVAGPDRALYVTDSRRARVYRMAGRDVTIALEDTLLSPPNGITWDPQSERLVLAPWGGGQTFWGWHPDETTPVEVASSAGGNFDGIEPVGGRLLVASQQDSSLYVLEDGTGRPLIRTAGRPADIGVDTRRMRVAVPYIALNRVDIWALPGAE